MIPDPEHLDYPFYAFSHTVPEDIDLSFSYHVVFQDNHVRGLCNDIFCGDCPFTCKEGEGRQAQLIEFARKHYPEHQI